MEERYVTSGAARLWAARQGNGPMAALLCHGGPGLWDYLGPVAEMIADRAMVYRFDQRGCGRSSGEGPWTMAQALADIEALRLAWGVERWLVIGHSFGATLALAYGMAFPQYTRGVGYIAGTGVNPAWHAAYHAEGRRRYSAEAFADLHAREARYRQAPEPERRARFREYAELQWASDLADPAQAGRVLAEMLAAPWLPNDAANRELGRAADAFCEEPAFHGALRQMAIPVWIFHGVADPRSIRFAAELAAAPHARLITCADCGHLPWAEQPVAFAESLRAWIAEVGRDEVGG